jgi:prepilin-type N-terminal cleavage/methylation domain-containing protein
MKRQAATSEPSPLASGLRSPRRGFTLIEMLVAMALTMFIMVILSEAFATGLDSFTQLKAIGDMEESLRASASVIRADLAADHFTGKRRLSDPDFYTNVPPEGFVAIYRPATAGVPAVPVPIQEGVDGYGLPSWRSTWHTLHLTVKRRGNQRGDTFSAFVPAGSPLLTVPTNFFAQPADARVQDNANTYNSQWAEVAYFLVCTGTNIEPSVQPDLTQPLPAGVIPLYALYRVERLVTPDNRIINGTNAALGTPVPVMDLNSNTDNRPKYAQTSWRVVNNNLWFNNPSELVNPANRSFYFGAPGTLGVPVNYAFDPTDSAGRGATLLATNVVSFHVRVLRGTAPGFNRPSRQYPDGDFADISYDSSNTVMTVPGIDSNGNPVQLPVFITGMAVALRVWDQKTQQARQITVMQDM